MKTFWLLCCLSPAGLFAQTVYTAASIPDTLKTNAHAVVRESKETFEVFSLAKAVYKSHEVVTVLDEQGRGDLFFGSYSYSFRKLDDADILVYDANGKLLQHVRQKQMSQNGYGEGLIEDGMYTYFTVTAPAYPLTVQMDYSETYKGAVNFPAFAVDNIRRSIENADYTLTLPKAMVVRFHNHLLHLEPQVTEDKDNRIYTWKASGVRAVRQEDNAPSDNMPLVYIEPTQFELAGFQGDQSSWSQFGKWIYDLNKPSYSLPEASKQFYKDMVRNAPTDLDKARIIYHYLQDNFRYVSIQLGIGGLRSFPASFTEQKKYGDCKGLSTYMSACLNAVGVKCYTALINAGYNVQPVDASFPHNAFNHMIVCLPRDGDSIWLECTSKHNDFGVLGGFTENRNALLITENGGVLVHTPASTAGENTTRTYSSVHLADDGGGAVEVTRAVSGEYKFSDSYGLPEADKDEQKKYLIESLDFPLPNTFDIHLHPSDTGLLRIRINLTYDKIPDFTAGTKMFLNPHLAHIWRGHLPADDHRRYPYSFNYPFTNIDTTCYQLPDGYTVDELPKGTTLNSTYAAYTSNFWYDSTRRSVLCAATLTLKIRVIPALDYPGFRRFFGKIVEDETEKVVIKKI